MKEVSPYPQPELPNTQFAIAAQLAAYLHHTRGIDQSIYSGELLMDRWGDDGAYVGFQTIHTQRPTGEETPLVTTCTIALPSMQGALTIPGDWIHDDMGVDSLRYEPLDGASTVDDAILILNSILGAGSDPRNIFTLPYVSMDQATHRTDVSRFTGMVAQKNAATAAWEIGISHDVSNTPQQVQVRRSLHSWSQLRWGSEGGIEATSESGTSPRPDTMIKHMWSEAAASIGHDSPEGRPLYPMEPLQMLCEQNLEAVLVRAGERPL